MAQPTSVIMRKTTVEACPTWDREASWMILSYITAPHHMRSCESGAHSASHYMKYTGKKGHLQSSESQLITKETAHIDGWCRIHHKGISHALSAFVAQTGRWDAILFIHFGHLAFVIASHKGSWDSCAAETSICFSQKTILCAIFQQKKPSGHLSKNLVLFWGYFLLHKCITYILSSKFTSYTCSWTDDI